MSNPRIITDKEERELDNIVNVLAKDFGWTLTDSLTGMGKALVRDAIEAMKVIEKTPVEYESTKLLMMIWCFFFGHNRKKGKFLSENGNYTSDSRCDRCKIRFGIPLLTISYMRANFPPPKRK